MPGPMSFDRVCYRKALMACHARRHSSCLRSKGYDGMPRPTSFDRVCSPKAVMDCHVRCRSTVCALQRRLFHVTPDVVRSCLLSRVYDGMPRRMSFGRVCCPKAMMACHARRRSIVCAVKRWCVIHDRRNLTVCPYQGRLCHATPDIVISYVQSMGGSIMPRLTLPTVCSVQGW